MSAKDKAWSKVMKYAAVIAREKRDPKKGNQHISWREAQKRAWKDPRVIKRKAEYHIKYSKKTTTKSTTSKKTSKRTTAPGKRPRGRPPKNKTKAKTNKK